MIHHQLFVCLLSAATLAQHASDELIGAQRLASCDQLGGIIYIQQASPFSLCSRPLLLG